MIRLFQGFLLRGRQSYFQYNTILTISRNSFSSFPKSNMPPKQNKSKTDLIENNQEEKGQLQQKGERENDKIQQSQQSNDSEQKSEIDILDDFKFNNEVSKVSKTKKDRIQISYERSTTPDTSVRVTRKRQVGRKEDILGDSKPIHTKSRNNSKDIQKQSAVTSSDEEEEEEEEKVERDDKVIKGKANDDQKPTKKGKYNCKENYEEIYKLIKEYRDSHTAPVDTLGCHMQGDQTLPLNDLNFQKLLAIILSVQTKDEITDMVMKKVIKEKITIDKAIEIPSSELKEIIGQVNFNSKKVDYIKNAAYIIKNTHNSVVPDKYEELVKIKGIGPKVANLFLQCAYNKTVGIAVDTHVHRISNRLKWVKTNTPEQTRIELEKFLDKQYWEVINQLLVGYGQSVCKPINPQCQICPINDKCPEGRSKLKGRKKVNPQ